MGCDGLPILAFDTSWEIPLLLALLTTFLLPVVWSNSLFVRHFCLVSFWRFFQWLEILLLYFPSRISSWTIPNHVAIIMDGNRRFANALRLGSPGTGHQYGAQKLYDVLEWCFALGKIREITVWALSTDNLGRASHELESIFNLCEEHLRKIASSEVVRQHQVHVRVIGERTLLPPRVARLAQEIEQQTSSYRGDYVLNIALAYGGREEIVAAAQKAVSEAGSVGALDVQAVSCGCYTQSDPDLIIRTGGELRLGGFLAWQCKYSELFFTDTLWPAFGRVHLLRALAAFHARQRRFGK